MDYVFKMALPNIISQINSKLPLSGGTLTGNIAIHTSNADISLGYKNLNDVVYTKPTTRQARAFRTHDNLGNILGDIRFGHETTGEINTAIIARYTDESGTRTNAELKLTPNASGTVGNSYLKFNGYDVITSKGGYTVNGNLYVKGNNYAGLQASSTSVTWGVGSAWNNAPSISLYTPAYTNNPGMFAVRAISSDGTIKELIGKPDGTLTWGGKPVVVLTENYVSGTTWYRKYSNGYMECGGRYTGTTVTSATITFPITFSNTNYTLTCQDMEASSTDTEGVDFNIMISNLTTTSFRVTKAKARQVLWYACGY